MQSRKLRNITHMNTYEVTGLQRKMIHPLTYILNHTVKANVKGGMIIRDSADDGKDVSSCATNCL
jgi:hypothetical protein